MQKELAEILENIRTAGQISSGPEYDDLLSCAENLVKELMNLSAFYLDESMERVNTIIDQRDALMNSFRKLLEKMKANFQLHSA